MRPCLPLTWDRSRRAGTASPVTTAGWSSSGMRYPASGCWCRITDDRHDRFWRGDAVQVLDPSPDRVSPPCPIAGPGLCGGCDFQHVDLSAQRRLKASVVAEQLRRLAGIDWTGEVEAVSSPGTEDGLGWRTRMRYTRDAQGAPGCGRTAPTGWSRCPRRLPDRRAGCAGRVRGHRHRAGRRATLGGGGGRVLAGAPGRGRHPGRGRARRAAAAAGGVEPSTCTAGSACSPACWPTPAAGSGRWRATTAAVGHARSNLADVADRVRITAGRVEHRIGRLPRTVDLVVLDPPRTGAGAR